MQMAENEAQQGVQARGWEEMKKTASAIASKVRIASKPDVQLKLRKKVDLAVLKLTLGTDMKVSFASDSGHAMLKYSPNYTCSLQDKYFGGEVGFDRQRASITYSKDFNVENINIGVDLSYHLPSNVPYLNFAVYTSPVRFHPLYAFPRHSTVNILLLCDASLGNV